MPYLQSSIVHPVGIVSYSQNKRQKYSAKRVNIPEWTLEQVQTKAKGLPTLPLRRDALCSFLNPIDVQTVEWWADRTSWYNTVNNRRAYGF
jgi:hypothetical protein